MLAPRNKGKARPIMPWLFMLFLGVHVGCGTVALLATWGAVLTRKGGPDHRYWGGIFTWAIYGAAAMALGMGALSVRWPLAMHPGLTDAALYRGLLGWMMLYLGVLVIGMTRYGRQMVTNRRDHHRNRRWPMIALQLAVLALGANCLALGLWLGQPLMILVSVIGFGTTLTYLWYLFRPAPLPRAYVAEHLKAMVATGIAAYTAFLSVGLIRMFPAHAFNPAIWAAPTVVGIALIGYFLQREKRGTKRPKTQLAAAE